eukprot:jgi/Mesvir1/13309/Mv08658-RA.1
MRAQAENEARRQQQMRQQQEDRAAAAASGAATSSASTTHGTAAPSSTSTSNSNATTPPELLAPARSLRLSEDAYAGSRDLAPGSGDVHAGPMGGSGHGSHALPGSALAWGQHFTQSSSGGHTRYLGTQLDGSGRGGMRRNSGSHNSLVEFGANAALVAHSHSSSGSGGGGGQERATQGGRSSGGGNTQVWSQEDEFWRRQGGAHEEGGAHGAVPLGAGPPGDWPLYTTASGGGAGANAGVGAPSSANVPPMAAGGGMQQGSSGGMQRSHHGDMGGGMTRGREGADASGGGNRGHRHQGSSGGDGRAGAAAGSSRQGPGVSSLNDFLATRLWNDVPLSDYFPRACSRVPSRGLATCRWTWRTSCSWRPSGCPSRTRTRTPTGGTCPNRRALSRLAFSRPASTPRVLPRYALPSPRPLAPCRPSLCWRPPPKSMLLRRQTIPRHRHRRPRATTRQRRHPQPSGQWVAGRQAADPQRTTARRRLSCLSSTEPTGCRRSRPPPTRAMRPPQQVTLRGMWRPRRRRLCPCR